MATAFPEASFDLVLFHHIVEYLEDPLRAFRDLITLTARGGELSLITLNPVSEVIRAIVFRKDADLANSKLADLGYDAKWFGRARLYSLEQILRWANLSGWALGDFRGIRVLADYIPEVEYTEGKEQQATHLEEKLAGMEPYRRIGRYLQFCFKK